MRCEGYDPHRFFLALQCPLLEKYAVNGCGNRILLPYNMTNRQEDQLTPVKLRQRIGLTQRQVAQALDIRQSTVSDWERGISIPNLPPSKIKLMLEIYQCSLDELIEAFEDTKKRKKIDRDGDAIDSENN